MPEKVLRFRSGPYRGKNSDGRTESRWHLPAGGYEPKVARAGGYLKVEAMCGYTLTGLFKVASSEWSNAVRPPRGGLCTKCIGKVGKP